MKIGEALAAVVPDEIGDLTDERLVEAYNAIVEEWARMGGVLKKIAAVRQARLIEAAKQRVEAELAKKTNSQ